LLEDVIALGTELVSKIYLLEDCTSPVAVPGVIDYTDQADEAFRRCHDSGMHVLRSTVPKEDWSDLGKPWRAIPLSAKGPIPLDCFFYGTLMDVDVLGAVIGRPASTVRRQVAVVEGYRRFYKLGASYPILVPMPGGRIEGVLASGLRQVDMARLVAFEGSDYDLVEVSVKAERIGPTRSMIFMSKPEVMASSEEWTLASWARRHKQKYLRRIRITHRAAGA
jgi:gamma-glutamylcyclotransferase (GGCT)/AIG2-like uncharacterized protein YtfP